MSPIPSPAGFPHSGPVIDELSPPDTLDDRRRAPTRGCCEPVALFFAAFGIGVLAAIVSGIAAGLLVALVSSNGCSPNDGWCDLGAIVFGLMAGVAAAAIGYVVSGVIVIRHHRDRGDRAMPILAHLAAAPVTGATLMLLLGFIT